MKPQVIIASVLLIFVFPVAALSLQPTQKENEQHFDRYSVGRLSGTVVFDASQLPARGATVSVQQIGAPSNVLQAFVDAKGNFDFPTLPRGRYKVSVSLTGYYLKVEPFPDLKATKASEKTTPQPSVSIDANGSQILALRLTHGASISGTALWEDGAPVIGAGIEVDRITNDRESTSLRSGRIDDLGNFRVDGLKEGRYRVAVLPRLSSFEDSSEFASRADYDPSPAKLRFFAKGVTEKRAAEVFTVETGAELTNVEIRIPLGILHSVEGRVENQAAKSTRAAFVSLTSKENVQVETFAPVKPDGSFTILLVPSGTYQLRIYAPKEVTKVHSGTTEQTDDEDDLVCVYQRALAVTDDVAGLILTLP